jgi:hypothetical protein
MRRGVRPIWREIAEAAQKVADSKNHAEEYVYTREFENVLSRLSILAGTPSEDA